MIHSTMEEEAVNSVVVDGEDLKNIDNISFDGDSSNSCIEIITTNNVYFSSSSSSNNNNKGVTDNNETEVGVAEAAADSSSSSIGGRRKRRDAPYWTRFPEEPARFTDWTIDVKFRSR